MKIFLITAMAVFGYSVLYVPAYAAVIKVESDFSVVHVGDLLTVGVTVDTQKQTLNAVETEVVFPSELLKFVSSDTSDSIITVWLRDTKEIKKDRMWFAGITPGGFTQGDARIISMTFKVLAEGQGIIEIQNTQLLLNDGLGTKAEVTEQNLHISVVEGAATIQEKSYYDDELPELFTVLIAHDADVFDGESFLVFATQDKGSGLSHYEIKEGIWGRYTKAESPYRVIHQKLDRNISVKAVDKVGNQRVVVVYPQNTLAWHQNISVIVSILVLCVLIVFYIGVLSRRRYFLPPRL